MNSANNDNNDRRAEVGRLATQLAQLLAAADFQERRGLEAAFAAAVEQALARLNPETPPLQSLKCQPLTPELRKWLDQQHSEEEMAAWVQELREKGGLELSEFLPELEEIVGQP